MKSILIIFMFLTTAGCSKIKGIFSEPAVEDVKGTKVTDSTSVLDEESVEPFVDSETSISTRKEFSNQEDLVTNFEAEERAPSTEPSKDKEVGPSVTVIEVVSEEGQIRPTPKLTETGFEQDDNLVAEEALEDVERADIPSVDEIDEYIEEEEEKERAEHIMTLENEFNQEGGSVDILFVYHNAISASKKRKAFSQKSEILFERLKGVDWRLGMITTDEKLEGGALKVFPNGSTFLTKNDVAYQLEFATSIKEGNPCVMCSAMHVPRPLSALERSFSRNPGFFRENTPLIVVFVTGQDETFSNKNAKRVLDSFQSKFGNEKEIVVHGLITLASDSQCGKSLSGDRVGIERARTNRKVLSLIEETDGVSGSICSPEKYEEFIIEITEDLGTSQQVEFELSHKPIPGAVEVHLSPTDSSLNWEVDGRVLRFDNPPKSGTKIKVIFSSDE